MSAGAGSEILGLSGQATDKHKCAARVRCMHPCLADLPVQGLCLGFSINDVLTCRIHNTNNSTKATAGRQHWNFGGTQSQTGPADVGSDVCDTIRFITFLLRPTGTHTLGQTIGWIP